MLCSDFFDKNQLIIKELHPIQYLNSSDQTFKMQQAFAEMVCGFEGERASLLLSS